MPIEIACPSCAKQLRVPENLVGTAVRCPSCQNTFTAQGAADGTESATQKEAPARRRPREPDERYEDDSGQRREGGGNYSRPDRSTMVMILGIVGLALSVLGCAIPVPFIFIGFGLSLAGWLLGRSDLKAIANGEMDPKAQGQTKGGWICGIIGTCIFVVYLLAVCVFFLIWLLFFGVAVSQAN
jgi:predicted Zn finger-like uncharacterized protein